MANALYDPGREGFLDGSIDWDTNDIRVMLALSTYTFSAAHKFISDLCAGGIRSGEALGLPLVSAGVRSRARRDRELLSLRHFLP